MWYLLCSFWWGSVAMQLWWGGKFTPAMCTDHFWWETINKFASWLVIKLDDRQICRGSTIPRALANSCLTRMLLCNLSVVADILLGMMIQSDYFQYSLNFWSLASFAHVIRVISDLHLSCAWDVWQTDVFLLPPVKVQDKNKKCVVIDLDETLVHSSFTVNNLLIFLWILH